VTHIFYTYSFCEVQNQSETILSILSSHCGLTRTGHDMTDFFSNPCLAHSLSLSLQAEGRQVLFLIVSVPQSCHKFPPSITKTITK
jgi:hypothetical protein